MIEWQRVREQSALRRLLALLWLLSVAGCATPGQAPVIQRVTPAAVAIASATSTPDPTATPSPTVTANPTATPTATPSPTPTPTPLPIVVSGNPYDGLRQPPTISGRYPCGVVDLFDFPLEPPDAANARGGGDFAVFRSRYDKFHAGEDWRAANGTPSLGQPVHSIGHGLVTFAEPLGWGADQGVVIVRHWLAGGGELLSFYGHLEPDSIVLTAGTCVARGEQVGRIGRPRTPPHLHFELRTQSPYATLTGYWPEDPLRVGWLPPSQTIWQQRSAAQPGTRWTLPYTRTQTLPLGRLQDGRLLLGASGGGLLVVDSAAETRRAILDLPAGERWLLHPQSGVLYGSDRSGRAGGWQVTDERLTPLWRSDVLVGGRSALLPLPGDGVLQLAAGQASAYAANGLLLWQRSWAGDASALHWALTAHTLYVADAGGALWQLVDNQPLTRLGDGAAGPLAAAGGALWLAGEAAILRVSATGESQAVLARAPRAPLNLLALPDGGLLLVDGAGFTRRLTHLAADGSVVWQRGLFGRVAGDVSLHLLAGQPYLLAAGEQAVNGGPALYTLDVTAPALRRVWQGGTRQPLPVYSWAIAVALPDGGEALLIQTGGGALTLWQPPGD